MMDPARHLLAIEEIKRLKARYFRLVDTHDWAGFAELFTHDALFDVRGAGEENPDLSTLGEPFRGVEAILHFVEGHIGPVTSVHHGHMPEIDLLSEDEATGIWSFEDTLRFPAGSPVAWLQGYGHYHETYRRVDGQWRIASLKITRLMVEKRFRSATDPG